MRNKYSVDITMPCTCLGCKKKEFTTETAAFFHLIISREQIQVCFTFIRLTHPELKGPIESFFLFFLQQVCCLLFTIKLLSTFCFRQMNNLQYCCKGVFLRYLIAKKWDLVYTCNIKKTSIPPKHLSIWWTLLGLENRLQRHHSF